MQEEDNLKEISKEDGVDNKLALSEHLEELRCRLIKSIVCIIIFSGLIYNFVNIILASLTRSVGKLVFIAPQEAFVTSIKLAFFGGLFVSSPFVIYQIWKFISRGLMPAERKYSLFFGPFSFIFFIAGAAFSYFLVVPIGVRFLLGFATDYLTPMISVSKYVSFVGTLIFAFGMIFQLPLVLLFLTKIGIVTPNFLRQKRKHAVVLIAVLAAVLTPPDVVTQVLMIVPLVLLYETGVIFSKIAYKKK